MQIKEEFRRITISLEQTFMYKLDTYTPKLVTLMKAKGGEVGTKLRPFLYKLSQMCVVLFLLLQEDGPFPLTFSHSHSLCDYISMIILYLLICIVPCYPQTHSVPRREGRGTF